MPSSLPVAEFLPPRAKPDTRQTGPGIGGKQHKTCIFCNQLLAFFATSCLHFVFNAVYYTSKKIHNNTKKESNMPNTLVQFRIDDTLRQQANDLCTKLGFDLPTYLRMSLTRLVQEQGVPFAIKLNSAPTANDAIAAMQKLSAISRANGNSEMTLDEINAEISAARNGRS